MSATIHTLQRTQSFPDRIEACLQSAGWGDLRRAIEAGFDPTITAYGGVSLFESILHRADQDTYVPPLCLPMKLLETLLPRGLSGILPCGKPSVVVCAEYGQWEWTHALLDAGFPAQNDAFPVLDAITLGRAKRCEDAVLGIIRRRLAGADGETDNARATQRSRRFSAAMMKYARTIYAKDARSLSHLVHRLVTQAGIDPDAPLRQAPAQEGRTGPGIRNTANALDDAILRQDEAMAFALIAAGARSDGAVVIDQAGVGSVACRPVDLALSARCYDLFIHILQENPDSKHALPGCRNPIDPASFPLTSVLISNLLPLENAAVILDELLRSSHGHWTGQDLGNAMHVAAKAGHVGMMKSLAAQGVAYDVPIANGFLPIHQACDGAQRDVIDFLLSRGGSLSDESTAGVRAIDLLRASSPDMARAYVAPPVTNVVVLRPRPRP